MKITFFGTQPYDRESFDRANERYGFEFNYHRSHLNGNNTSLAQGADAVCIFEWNKGGHGKGVTKRWQRAVRRLLTMMAKTVEK